MALFGENDDKEYNLRRSKQRPAPIVSLGKIIGYKLACFGVTIKTMNVFHKSHGLRKLLRMDRKRRKQQDKESNAKTKSKPVKVKRSVSFCDSVQEKSIEENEEIHEIGDEKQDTNVNASQGADCDVKDVGRSREMVSTNGPSIPPDLRKLKSHDSKFGHKSGTTSKMSANSCVKTKSRKMKNKAIRGTSTPRDEQTVIRTRSTSALAYNRHSLTTSNLPSKQSSQTFAIAHSSARGGKKKQLRSRKLELIKRDLIKPLEDKTQTRSGKSVRKSKVLDSTTRRKTLRLDNSKPHEFPSTSSMKGFLMRHSSKPKESCASKSPSKTSCKTGSYNIRRWADVVAGTSKEGEEDQVQTQSSTNTDSTVEKSGETSDNQTSDQEKSTITEVDDTALPNASRRSKRIQIKETNAKSAQSREKQGNKDKEESGPSVEEGKVAYQNDFPSLQELKSKNQKREKWCQRQKEEEQNSDSKKARKKRKRLQRLRQKQGSLDRSKKQRKNQRIRLLKKQANEIENGEKSDKKRIKTRKNKKDKSKSQESSSSYTVDNIQEVVIQPVSKVCQLGKNACRAHQRKSSTNVESTCFTLVAVSPKKDDAKNDICSKLDAMSVTGNAECASSSSTNDRPESKAENNPPEGDKSPRTNVSRAASKSKLDEPGPSSSSSQKKISARYRALLRRDRGSKVDAKRATEIFNCGRWVDVHQREKIHDRFDVHQQRRNERTKDNNSQRDGTTTSGVLNTLNTLYYYVPQNDENAECLLM